MKKFKNTWVAVISSMVSIPTSVSASNYCNIQRDDSIINNLSKNRNYPTFWI